MSEEKRLVDVPLSEQISGTYYFVVNDNGATMQVSKAEMTRYFDRGITDWSQLENKPFTDVDSIQFDTIGNVLKIKNYHSHDNLDILNKFSVSDENKLLFDGTEIEGSVPEASDTVAGIVYIDDVINSGNTNNHATTTKAVSDFVSTQRVEIENNIPRADNDTIKNNGGILSADVIGNWSSGNTYNVGYFAVYNDNLYECIVANSDTEWTESHWTPIGSSGGTTGTVINNWSATTDYKINDLVINETTLYQCNTEHTSGEVFDETELANWTALTGARGEKGDKGNDGVNGKDGASPTIDPTTKNWIVGTVDTGVKAEAQSNYFYTGTEFPTSDLIDGDLYLSFAEETKGNVYQYQESTLDWSLQGNLYGGGAVIDDTSTTGNTVTWSASKINSVIGDINTILASVTGGIV